MLVASPAFVLLKSPYGGYAFRTRRLETAYERIERLLALDPTCELTSLELSVLEPCGRALYDDVRDPYQTESMAQRVKRHRHTLDDLARTTWKRFGEPVYADTRFSAPHAYVRWLWRRGASRSPQAPTLDELAAWLAFAGEHQEAYVDLDDDLVLPCVEIRALWCFRVPASAGTVEPPRGTVSFSCKGTRANAVFGLCFPFTAPCAALDEAFTRVCEALGMDLRRKNLRVSAPSRSGGRVLKKLPT